MRERLEKILRLEKEERGSQKHRLGDTSKRYKMNKVKFGRWYNEYSSHIRIHDYISIMINQFPIFVIRKYDNPHSEKEDMERSIQIGILGFSGPYKGFFTFLFDMNRGEIAKKIGILLVVMYIGTGIELHFQHKYHYHLKNNIAQPLFIDYFLPWICFIIVFHKNIYNTFFKKD